MSILIWNILTEMTTIEKLSNQLIPIIAVVAFAWYISHFAKATIPRLLLVCFGAYFAIVGATDFDKFIGIGLALPHIKFFFVWIIDILDSFRRGTLDLYYSFLTIYYKTRNIFIRAYSFFSGKKSSQKSTGSNYYQKQEYRQYEDFGQSSKNENKKQQRQEKKEQEESYQESYSSYEEVKIHDDIPNEYQQFFSTQIMQ